MTPRTLAITCLAAAALLLAACTPVKGSGNVVSKKLAPAAPFTAVRGEGAVELALRTATGAELTVEADDNLHELLRTEVKDGTLRIWTDRSWTSDNPFRVTVRAPSFSGVDVSGAVRATADALVVEGGKVTLSASGASTVTVDAITCKVLGVTSSGASVVTVSKASPEKADVEASGSSRVMLTANCTKATVSASGASKVGDAGFVAAEADVSASGASHVDMDVSGTLKAGASGASGITYGGSPAKVTQDASGTSTVKKR